ncbi:hypothetical protein [Labedaea rhizosphaerae]|uniref:Uncharacterized protein n=1 Tax=Labedaea rhizosphaerae TaxID=598644 RepID=A0A4R6SN36_LABRH|nr:hypothetical protein [Labedaea rhizosphaerae]TDQ04782.1 hypothetical protein EV186_101739 [Labedaea rhizosphaerae]
MTQVADRVALPIRVHDTLLALAGRLDDDAVTEARALLASAELDRAVELVAGCLVAGAIPVSAKERTALVDLVAAANCDTAMLDGLAVGGGGVRHRFTDGRAAQQPAAEGVADALVPVLDALPDIASVWAVWRTTPAGSSPGPVPQRVVLVELGATGVAPATAYRMQHALQRADIHATVEVLRDGVPRESYHADAMLHATKLDLPGGYQADQVPSWQSDPEPPLAESPLAEPPSQSSEPFSYLPDPEPVAEPELAPMPAPAEQSYQPPAWQQAAEPPPSPAKPVIRAVPNNPVPNNPAQDESALNDQERDLLRQLHEELAKREQGPGTPTPPRGTPWPSAQSAQHTGPHRTFDWPSSGTHQVNGMPPAGDHPPFPSA